MYIYLSFNLSTSGRLINFDSISPPSKPHGGLTDVTTMNYILFQVFGKKIDIEDLSNDTEKERNEVRCEFNMYIGSCSC